MKNTPFLVRWLLTICISVPSWWNTDNKTVLPPRWWTSVIYLRHVKQYLADRNQYLWIYFHCYYFEWEKDGNVRSKCAWKTLWALVPIFRGNKLWGVCVAGLDEAEEGGVAETDVFWLDAKYFNILRTESTYWVSLKFKRNYEVRNGINVMGRTRGRCE